MINDRFHETLKLSGGIVQLGDADVPDGRVSCSFCGVIVGIEQTREVDGLTSIAESDAVGGAHNTAFGCSGHWRCRKMWLVCYNVAHTEARLARNLSEIIAAKRKGIESGKDGCGDPMEPTGDTGRGYDRVIGHEPLDI